mgnify:CR=1 FL=1
MILIVASANWFVEEKREGWRRTERVREKNRKLERR